MKKTLSVILSLLMMLSVITPFNVFANDSVSVEYSVCDAGMFTLTPQTVNVTADLSDKYQEQIGYNDSKAYPTILDATIAAHIAMFGEEDFEYSDPFKCSSATSTTAAFGEETFALSYRLNGKTGDGEIWYDMDSQIKNGDYIEFMFYQDTDYWSDYYTSFDKRDVTITLGQSVTLNVSADMFGMPAESTEGLTITDLTWSEEYGTVDENSQFTFAPTKAGTYYLTAYGDIDYCPIFAPYCKVTVEKTPLQAQIDDDIEGEIAFLNLASSLSTSVDAYTLARANALNEKAFLTELEENLKENAGKIVINGKEDIIAYCSVVNILCTLGLNPSNYNGFDIAKMLCALSEDASTTVSNPYYYRVVIEAFHNIRNDEKAKKYADEFIKDYYTMGKGMNYWGYSCDNTAVFLTALAPVKDDYQTYIDDAIKVIEAYTTIDGCFYSTEYTSTSADSTAVALMAYAAIGRYDMANFLYQRLMTAFESTTKNGVIVAYGSENAYATKEALLALTYVDALKVKHNSIKFLKAVAATCGTAGKTAGASCNTCGEIFVAQKTIKATGKHKTYYIYSPSPKCRKTGIKITYCENCSYQKKETVKALGDKYHRPIINTQEVKPTYFTAGKTASYKCEDCGTIITKSKAVAKKKPTISKLTGGKKSFKITTKKVDKATGYQIQYSRYSDFKYAGNYRTKYATKTISNLRANKKYYVRVRAYKTTNGKTVYSSWSASKTVKTK